MTSSPLDLSIRVFPCGDLQYIVRTLSVSQYTLLLYAGEAETASTEAPRPPMAPHSPLASTSGRPPTHASPPGHASSRHEADTLHISGQGYHVAHTVLLLLRMQQTYLSFRGAVPLLAAETARRATDLLKVKPTF